MATRPSASIKFTCTIPFVRSKVMVSNDETGFGYTSVISGPFAFCMLVFTSKTRNFHHPSGATKDSILSGSQSRTGPHRSIEGVPPPPTGPTVPKCYCFTNFTSLIPLSFQARSRYDPLGWALRSSIVSTPLVLCEATSLPVTSNTFK